MRIAHIVGSLEARYGGPSRSVRRIADATAELGHEVELLTSAPAPLAAEISGRMHVRTWRRGWPGAFCPVPGMATYLAESRLDVVHHHGLWLRTLHYARRKAARDRIPLVVSPRGMMAPWAWQHHRARKAFAAQFLHPGAFAAANGWHATSNEEADEIRRCGFAQPICVAPNGVDRPQPRDVEAANVAWRRRVPAADTRPVALFYGRLHAKKRVLELIALWSATALADWLLLIVGVPEQYSIAELRARVAAAGAEGRIEVHDGLDQPPPYPIATLFLLPSHNENFGLAIAEAMAHGVPVAVTDSTPWRAINRDELGWCVAWEEFGETVRRATAEGTEHLRARGTRARDWVLREMSWSRSAQQLAEFYVALASKLG